MKKLLFVITQFYKGGAEVALLNLFKMLSSNDYEIDFLIFDQVEIKNAVSLVSQIPSWITVCNASQGEGKIAFIKKIFFKIYRKLSKKQLYRKSAYNFVKNSKYDCAFSYGEWMSPEFVATKVNASNKFVWIHADIDKAPYVDEKVLFNYDKFYQHYIFVSTLSMQSAVRKYPFLDKRTYVIHNMCNDGQIRKKAQECITLSLYKGNPILLTVANVRPEKNHLRQIEAMHILKDKGIFFTWINIGSNVNILLSQQVKSLAGKYGLSDHFILLGADSNPYKYMLMADAVTVLSDFEAWSFVITEAKLLGIPVIATKTSGALEQIKDGETGLLCDFSAQSIADTIERFLSKTELKNNIKNNLLGFSSQNCTLSEFEALMEGSTERE